jgi:uncharacterized protein YegL
MMEILPFLTSPMGCDLPMSLVLSCSPSLITENLTRYRYGLLKKLNSLRADGKLHSFWTHDGSIIVKRSENSGFMTVKKFSERFTIIDPS